MTPDLRPAGGIQSVARACRILMSVAASDGGLSARDLSRTHSLTLPTTYNLLATLCAEGFLLKGPDHRFTLGPARFAFADSLRTDPGPSAHQVAMLQAVADRTRETTYLSAWQGDRVVIEASIEGTEPLRVAQLRPGFSAHMHARASAKLLLATTSARQRERVLKTLTFEPLTERTITDPAAFITELDTIRRRGLAYDRQEYHLDIAGISAGITEGDAVVASLTVAVPAQRFARTRVDVRDTLLDVVSGRTPLPG